MIIKGIAELLTTTAGGREEWSKPVEGKVKWRQDGFFLLTLSMMSALRVRHSDSL